MSFFEKMSTADLMENLREELTCFICLDYFTNPVTTECGHSFCLMCLLKSWEEHNTSLSCPECWRTLETPHFQPNERLGRLAGIGKQLRRQVLQSEGELRRMLATAKLLSDEEQGVKAFSTQGHGGNRVYLSNEAGEHHKVRLAAHYQPRHKSPSITLLPQYSVSPMLSVLTSSPQLRMRFTLWFREKLQETLNLLRKKKKETQVILTHEKERVILCTEETKTCKQAVVSEYIKMHQFLKEEEQIQLHLLEKEERENMKKLRDNELKLTQQVRSLTKLIEQIESTCQNSTVDSLEDVRGTLERSEPLLLQCPEATITRLSLCRITGMREMLRKFSTDISLDPATANAYLVLSEDLRSVRHGGIRQQLPDNPERFDQSATVLGAQTFTCGRHYWEVDVGNKTEWEVGICKDSLSRKGNLPKPPGDLFSLIGLKIGDDYSLWVSSPLKGQHVREPVHKVGVFLDYESGHIAFYNVTDESLIYSFPPTSFQEALRPIFSPCLPNEGTNAGPLTICSLNSHA
ncbi:putative E3 ubiquitin-protein ligase TRIML1 [Galemys pyrenaicus]|uniref:Putative E3 ubiquitin-protein ligase TRIML1 n=1 Tax=Galemys pyrenaicus TaxID=202257 RepID=A0A8J5ZZN6_GALPY|nr:putative E3 ubiquitin-protein ligase TRIML1 [Galemys pyrenaicus]